jgi:hypothetical protein
MLIYTSYISVAVTLVYTVNFKDLNSPFPLLRFRSALHCIVVIVVSLIFKMAYFLS